MRDKRRIVGLITLLRVAAGLTILFSVLTALDVPHRNIELFSHFRLQYFVVSVLLLIAFAVLRRFRYVFALSLIVVFNATYILPWYWTDVTDTGGTSLKLIHANVHSGNSDYQRLIELVREEDPDLFILQEVTADWVAATRVLLQDYPYAYTEARTGNFGIAAFSKTPYDTIQHVDSPPLNYPTIVARLTVARQQLTIISSHPTIPVNRALYDARNIQLASIAERVKRTDGKVILLGDLNASIWDAEFRKLQDASGLRNVREGYGVLPSWPTFFPLAMIPIDHALVSNEIGVSALKTGDSIGSDHLPLIITLSL